MSIPLTFAERLLAGQQQRKRLKRTGHAEWDPSVRKQDPLKLLQRAVKGRIPSLVKLKYERMSATPFTWFRGSASVMAYDLSLSPDTAILNQICGDAHVSNLGAYEGPDGRLHFDINDFDETMPAPFEWDVKRMATSILLAGRDAGAKDSHCRGAAETMLESYRDSINSLTRKSMLDVARHQVGRIVDIPVVEKILADAKQATPLHTLDTLTSIDPKDPHKARVFNSNPPLLQRVTGPTAQAVIDSLTTYAESLQPERRHLLARYRIVDVGFKVVGNGAVGLRDYIVYLEGNGPDDPLFLQIKQEVASAYAPYLGEIAAAPIHQGRRVVEGARAMQFQSDPFLGWTNFDGRDYLVRQLNDHKATIDVAALKAAVLPEYAAVCGEVLARGHARAGDCVVISGYLGDSDRFDQAILKYAQAYADQCEVDWKKFTAWLKSV